MGGQAILAAIPMYRQIYHQRRRRRCREGSLMMDTATYKAVNRARVALTQGKKTFVIVDENKLLHYSEERGLYPLVNLIETEPSKLEGAVIGDRITGRAAALLCIAGNVKAVFSLIIADEAISSLDISVGMQILRLFRELRESLGLTIIFISHNTAAMNHFCGRIAVMKNGAL